MAVKVRFRGLSGHNPDETRHRNWNVCFPGESGRSGQFLGTLASSQIQKFGGRQQSSSNWRIALHGLGAVWGTKFGRWQVRENLLLLSSAGWREVRPE